MRLKYSLFVIALMLTVYISSQQVVRGGPPASAKANTGVAAIKGMVKFEGAPPKGKPISMGADPSCAKQHSGPVATLEVVTDSKGGLENVLVFISDGWGDRTFDPPKAPVFI